MNNSPGYLRPLRYAIQAAFLAVTIFAGFRFYQFVQHFINPARPFVERPSSVDGFLPIGGLMAFKFFLFTGMVEPTHPAGFVLFTAILTVSLFVKKGFCSWICPVGTISQYVWMAGEKALGRNFRIVKPADWALRSLKYLLMAAFLAVIGIAMAPNMLVLFFITDYYKIADVRMLKLFTDMSVLTFWVLVGLVLLSVLYKNFWCRYLCPYGALLGLLSRLSPFKVRRHEENCSHCRACSQHCPSLIDVEKKELIKSEECFGCLTCVSRCPSAGALELSYRIGKKRGALRPYLFPAVLVVLFYLVIAIGMATGNWKSKIPSEEYQRLVPEVEKEYSLR